MANSEQTLSRPGGNRKRRARPFPKGRQASPQSLQAITSLLGDAAPTRDRLIETLHRIQDHFGHLSKGHLTALAQWMQLPLAEVFEVASFYHHFQIVDDGAPQRVTIRVCDSLPCQLAGAEQLLHTLHEKAGTDIRVVRASCMGLCDRAPAVAIGCNYRGDATSEEVLTLAGDEAVEPQPVAGQTLAAYRETGGLQALASLPPVNEVISTLQQAGLRGLGGAGFPAGDKWRYVRAGKAPRYLCINADEGEPGTFKDRKILATEPFQLLEGALIAARCIDAERVYLYLRDEYAALLPLLRCAVADLEGEGLSSPGFIELRRGAGAYICGEESALIESIEGKRGLPRQRPPYVAECGLFGQPTLVHNVETLYWIPAILRRGADWFAAQGVGDARGLRSWSVSGRVKRPGVVQAGAGITANELLDRCGGMAAGHRFAAYLPGGASGGILPAHLGNLPLDFGSLDEYGCFVGSHAVIILSDQDALPGVVHNLMRFFARESCGQCTPCRVGCTKAVQLMDRPQWDQALLRELADVMADASICGLGQAAPNPLLSLLRRFADEVPR